MQSLSVIERNVDRVDSCCIPRCCRAKDVEARSHGGSMIARLSLRRGADRGECERSQSQPAGSESPACCTADS
eukprot:2391407-Pleurochrysis_carterae.AAC.1